MSKKFLIILLTISFFFELQAQEKRALLVGISKYDIALTGYQWNNINGANDVKLLKPILKSKGFKVSTLINEQATHNNIIDGINKLIATSKNGDIVYFHFSGHGQPVEDINGDEADGWDESLIPVDARKVSKKGVYEGNKHILDDDLAHLITKLRAKVGPTGVVYVVIDACHAGTASKGLHEDEDECPSRGTMQGFTYTRGKYFKPKKLEMSNYYKVQKTSKMSNVVFFEACRPYQFNREIKTNSNIYGPLSYHMAQVIKKFSLSTNASSVISQLNKEIMEDGLWPMNQNLVIEKSL